MGKIEVMDHALANQIAAGEVVERPASVVKELIENAIDAHAKNIRVSVFNAGRTKIVVEDDGEGMDRVDALLAFKRHATSKLKKTLDLFRIKTLGFRGEALPSIASVSKLTLVTSTGSGTGTEIVLEDEQEIVKDASLRKGTIVTVEELFYNTPARLKYLKTDYTENAATTEIVSRLALAHPDVAFSFSLDDRIQFETTGRGELLEVILTIYGHGVASKMIPFSFETNDFAVSGFLGKAELAKSNRY
ncbi:MAG: DNA mismatch repair protein MutL, partial [Methanomicrobia archaeon]|nr:DNA mismatch repair protein MutL [Methanomicrobia archaeon]